MSGHASPSAPQGRPDVGGRLSLRRLARTWPRAIVTTWIAIVVVLSARVLGDPGLALSGESEALIPAEHRAPEDRRLLLLTVEDDAQTEREGGTDRLLRAASALAEHLGERRVPLGPPATELTAWLDAHALYLLPVSAHEALAQRLSDTAMAAAVDALRARLTSPLYGVSDEEPRRDPLRLHDLSREHAGRMTLLGNPEDMPAELTAAGDLLARDGRALLMQLRGDETPEALLEEILSVRPDPSVDAALVGPPARRARMRAAMLARWRPLLLMVAGGLVVVLSLALRAIRPVLAILLALGSTGLGILVLGPTFGPHDIPMLVLLAGCSGEGAMHLTRISPRGWPTAAVLGAALVPLSLSTYPGWRAWSLHWLLAVIVMVIQLRLVVPALLVVLRYDPVPARRGFRLRPLRPLSVLLAVGALTAGAWGIPRLPFLAVDRTPEAASDQSPERRVREAFFDPRLVVHTTSSGESLAAALEHAAEHARQLAALVPGDAIRVDSPGRLVLPLAELRARQRSLTALELPERMAALREQLSSRGFRPDAFGEFLRGAANLDELPTPQAALDGPLGAWIRGYQADPGAEPPRLAARVHLHPDIDGPVPRLLTEDGEELTLFGPAVAARRDRQSFDDWLGIFIAGQLWLGALVVWLGTRSLPAALGCGCAALSAQTAVLAVMVPLGLSLGAALLPALLLVGAAATVAGGRACQSVRTGQPIYATGVLLSGLCQAVAGLALFASGEPLWSHVGLVTAVGSVLASGAGLFVAPGMMRVFSSRDPVAPTTTPAPPPPRERERRLDGLDPSSLPKPSEMETVDAGQEDDA